jgi:hypothetical protein
MGGARVRISLEIRMQLVSQTNSAVVNKALQSIIRSALNGVAAGGADGAPNGVLYAAMQTQGATFSQYGQLIAALKDQHLVTEELDVLYLTDLGRDTLARLTH